MYVRWMSRLCTACVCFTYVYEICISSDGAIKVGKDELERAGILGRISRITHNMHHQRMNHIARMS